MNSKLIAIIFYEAIKTALLIAGPILTTILIVGLLVSIFQAATQINEQTLSFIPKIISVVSILTLLGPWMLNTILNYTYELFTKLPSMIN